MSEFRTNENGSLTNSSPINEDLTYKQFIITEDPSQYAFGTAHDDFDDAQEDFAIQLQAGNVVYLIELHYSKKEDDSFPIAVFVYDNELKRTRIV